MSEKIYVSSIAPYISGFIAERQSLGYKYVNQARIMASFDKYWFEHGYEKTGLSYNNLEGWLQMKKSEGAATLTGRVSTIRQFSKFLNGLGVPSYIPPLEVRYEVPIRYPLSKEEIEELFSQIDSYYPAKRGRSSSSIRIANEYPVLFRLLYLNGMRITEACSLLVSNVDLVKGTIVILDGKNNKDRLIYLADDMKNLCIEYLCYMRSLLKEEPKWFFPGETVQKHIGISSVEYRFNTFLERTSIFEKRSVKPTVHDLRHTFVVDRINQWIAQGLSFEQMQPYLSKFLGHKSYKETFYYYHYVEETAKNIHNKDKTVSKVIPEVMRR